MRCEPCSASRAAAAAPLRAHCAAPGWRVLALCAAALLQGCVQMASSASVTSAASMISSASSSELISSPFRASSRSSGEQQQQQQEQQRQRREIEGYIIVLLQRGTVAREALYQGLAGIAGRYGISDWEAEPGLWQGVGGGLAAAGLDAARAGDYARDWSAGDAERTAAVMRGYALGRERPAAVVL